MLRILISDQIDHAGVKRGLLVLDHRVIPALTLHFEE